MVPTIIKTGAKLITIRAKGDNIRDNFCWNSDVFIKGNTLEFLVCMVATMVLLQGVKS